MSLTKKVGELIDIREVGMLTIKGHGVTLISISSGVHKIVTNVRYSWDLPGVATTVLDIAGYPS